MLFAQPDEQQRGALVELGAALAAGKQVYMVTPHECSLRYHPQVQFLWPAAPQIQQLVRSMFSRSVIIILCLLAVKAMATSAHEEWLCGLPER